MKRTILHANDAGDNKFTWEVGKNPIDMSVEISPNLSRKFCIKFYKNQEDKNKNDYYEKIQYLFDKNGDIGSYLFMMVFMSKFVKATIKHKIIDTNKIAGHTCHILKMTQLFVFINSPDNLLEIFKKQLEKNPKLIINKLKPLI